MPRPAGARNARKHTPQIPPSLSGQQQFAQWCPLILPGILAEGAAAGGQPAARPAYERPAETGVFTCHEDEDGGAAGKADLGCGCAEFVAKEELERRRGSLLAEDCLAVRCDVGVVQVEATAVVEEQQHKWKGYGNRKGCGPYGRRGRGRGRGRGVNYSSYDYSDYDFDGDEGGRLQQPQDDGEFIRQCLTKRRGT
ncbi:hypothetical protein EJB05_09256, partial [Eragrostis curvula]